MDADLQHEPEAVPGVADPVLSGEYEFSVGSRNVEGGGLGFEWSFIRRLISKGATMLCLPLTTCTDPMSGFFCTNKTVLARGRKRCNPIGFKIGLELMVRCRAGSKTSLKDVGIVFRDREEGESKLTMRQNIEYLQQLAALYWDQYALVLFVFFVFLLYVLWQFLL